ncbi:MAG: phosphohistidine phosphatase SixA [Planctomycetia bacterium]|nr:phosphohistidine phosphatase SixA [Planctomycetia bacterium]
MQLYILRHADALDMDGETITCDEERPLSEKGREQVKLLAKTLSQRDIRLDLVLTSPLKRCRESAELLMEQLGRTTAEVNDLDLLAPGGSTKKLMKYLRTLEIENVLLVGHNPEVGDHIAYLIGDKDARIKMSKGALACVDCKSSPRKAEGELVLLVSPEWLG